MASVSREFIGFSIPVSNSRIEIEISGEVGDFERVETLSSFSEDILQRTEETRYLYLGNSKPPDCGRGQNLHGRTRTLDGQCLYRTAVAVIQVPGRLSQRLR